MYALRRQRFLTKLCKFGGSGVPVKIIPAYAPVFTRFPKLGTQSLTTKCIRKVFAFHSPTLHNNGSFSRRYYGSESYPSHTLITMPALSPTMTMGAVGKWQKKVGDAVTPGDVLVEIETDKASMDFECQEEGYLAKILIESGAKDVNVGSPLAILTENKEDIEKFSDFVPDQKATSKVEKIEHVEEIPKKTEPPKSSTQLPEEPTKEPTKTYDRILVSPVARKLASERGISLDQVTGTGPKDRIVKADILNWVPPVTKAKEVPASEPISEYTDIPLSNMRKIIAERLSESSQTIPHYFLTIEVDMNKALKLREELNNDSNGKYKLSVNDFIIKSSALALMDMPQVNSSWHDTFIRQYRNADISVAVATPNGLITPIIKNAQTKGLATISNEVRELAGRAKENKLSPHEYQGGTFSISNLGMYGIKSFTAIINPPQSCILAVGSAGQTFIPDSSQETGYRIVNTMQVTLSCDHRTVDGALGAQWLSAWKVYMENPIKMLL
ncbi:4643_t:CDS:2 [Diversispora eburnea]|uniref:Acetyltransferase component of pyruvate dehydrogenase complex n=1 Tax=Diversispora eburnea TaxID=1213867 RepID=A0A9N8ZQC7_9GLOM|nr:4643_t:CDS:2 [Diversispora eburnea]